MGSGRRIFANVRKRESWFVLGASSNPDYPGGQFFCEAETFMKGMRTAAVFALLAFAPALSATAPIDKEALHVEMAQLQPQIEALSKSSEQRLALSARFDEISASLGGDKPCAIGPVQVGSSEPRAAPAAPTGCSPVLNTFENTTQVTVPDGPAVVTSTIVVNGAGTYLWDVDVT